MNHPKKIFVAGGGRIGSLLSLLLSETGDYHVCIGDSKKIKQPHPIETIHIDFSKNDALLSFLEKYQPSAIVSCLPFFLNEQVANAAKRLKTHYFDLSEDRKTRNAIKEIAKNQNTAFVSACGTAPGFVNIIAHHLAKDFDEIETIKLRVGCLPLIGENLIQYALTWSTEGLINEYANLCSAIVDGNKAEVMPLTNTETITLDGTTYEAFNTSGGLGTLAETYAGRVKQLNYKTIRYPGHCQHMRFLMNDLKLSQNRNMLKQILENALPETDQDVTTIYVSVQGKKNGRLMHEAYLKKFYPETLFGERRSSIQITTASSTCAVIDMVLRHPNRYKGVVLQEHLDFSDFNENRFGEIFNNISYTTPSGDSR